MATIQAKSAKRREDLRLLTGRGNYAADAAPPGMAVAVFCARRTHMQRLSRWTSSPARGMAGVIGVYTAAT